MVYWSADWKVALKEPKLECPLAVKWAEWTALTRAARMAEQRAVRWADPLVARLAAPTVAKRAEPRVFY